jgi:guanylate kinase
MSSVIGAMRPVQVEPMPPTSPSQPRTDQAAQAGMVLVISGPSGVGKTTITRHVVRSFPEAVFSVSATTRPKTAADTEGVDYFFVSDDAFQVMVDRGEFLEHAGVFGKRYGTPRRWVNDRLSEGKLVVLEIDVQGAINVKREIPEAFSLFVLPPSEETLLERLRARKREDETVIQRRFGAAQHEIAVARSCGVYDAFLVNNVLADAEREAVDMIAGECARRGLKIAPRR